MRENNGVYCSPTTWCGIHLSVATPNRQNDNDQFRTILLVTQPYMHSLYEFILHKRSYQVECSSCMVVPIMSFY